MRNIIQELAKGKKTEQGAALLVNINILSAASLIHTSD